MVVCFWLMECVSGELLGMWLYSGMDGIECES